MGAKLNDFLPLFQIIQQNLLTLFRLIAIVDCIGYKFNKKQTHPLLNWALT